MKLEITEDDYHQLSEEARERYVEWCNEHGYKTYDHHDPDKEYVPLFNVGQMLEYLYKREDGEGVNVQLTIEEGLCDKLWSYCRRRLEQN